MATIFALFSLGVLYFYFTVSIIQAHGINVISYNQSEEFYNNFHKHNQFILFHTSWCGHCLRVKPIFEKLSDKYNRNDSARIILAKVNCDHLRSLCYDLNVTRYPTLQFFWAGQDKSFIYKGKQSYVNLYFFIEKFLKVEHKKAPIWRIPFELTSSVFQDIISLPQYSFIKFFTPWCSHCQAMSPVWKHLRDDYVDSKIINIAEVDCTKYEDICDSQDIKGYPSLIVFKSGRIVSHYYGERDYDMIKYFIESSLNKNEFDTIIKEERSIFTKDDRLEGLTSKDKSEGIIRIIEDEEETFEDEFDLNEANFRTEIQNKVHFILYFVTSCPLYKSIKKDWIQLHKSFTNSNAVTLSQVNCLIQNILCHNEGVYSFPSVVFYFEGQKVSQYINAKSFLRLKELIQYLAQNNVIDENKAKSVLFEFLASRIIHGVDLLSEHGGPNIVLFYTPIWNYNFEILALWAQLSEEWSDKQKGFMISAVNSHSQPLFGHLFEIQTFPVVSCIHDRTKVEELTDIQSYKALTQYIEKVISNNGFCRTHNDRQLDKDEL